MVQFYHYFEDKENIYILLEYCSRRVRANSPVSALPNRKLMWCLEHILAGILAGTVHIPTMSTGTTSLAKGSPIWLTI